LRKSDTDPDIHRNAFSDADLHARRRRTDNNTVHVE
jgi:hypothetical protein